MTAGDARPGPAPVLAHAGRFAGVAFASGIAALALSVWGFALDPQRAFHSYLTAFAFAQTLAVGSIGFVMIAHAANTTWPVAVRRLPEAVAPALPVLLLLFVPIIVGIPELYPWAHPGDYEPRVRALLEHRRAYMNPSFFAVRALLYLAIWSAIGLWLRGSSLAVDRGADPTRSARRLRRASYAGLVITALTVGFSGFEWLMSLSPEFSSTMFGALWIAACLFGGMALIVVLTGLAQRSAQRLPAPGPAHYSALGRLLFAFLIFLGYTVFFQFMLVWIGNRPGEAEWFVIRSHGAYVGSSVFLVLGHFFLPFFLLLSYRLKRRIEALRWVGAYCLAAQYVHVHWLVTPSSREPGWSWLDPVTLIAVLGTATGVCLWSQAGKQLAPSSDPRYAEAFLYHSR